MSEKQRIKEFTVKEELLADHMGSGSLRVLATPAVAAFFEGAAAELAQQGQPEGITTVGTKITVEHLAATAPGCRVRVTAELMEWEGRICRFRLQAEDNAGIIATGTHERVAVDAGKFLQKAEKRKSAVLSGAKTGKE